MRVFRNAVAISCVAFALACKAAEAPASLPDSDADPLALLPAGAIAVGALDVHAAAASPSVGPSLDALASAFVPVGDEAGLKTSRDVDRVTIAGYGGSSVDVIAVFSGRFDVTRIAAATRTKSGAAVVASKYLGFDVYTTGNTAYSPISAKTFASGTLGGVHRLLERLHDGKPPRAIPSWVGETLSTPAAPLAVAADFSSQPIATATLGSVSVGWLKGLRVARVLGDFKPPGMNVAATLSYGDAREAQDAETGVHLLDGWLRLLAPVVSGMTVQNLSAHAAGADLACTFDVDDATLRTLASLAPHALPAMGK